MKIEVHSGHKHNGTIQFIDCNEPFKHGYYMQVIDKNGDPVFADRLIYISKEDLKRIARAEDRYKY